MNARHLIAAVLLGALAIPAFAASTEHAACRPAANPAPTELASIQPSSMDARTSNGTGRGSSALRSARHPARPRVDDRRPGEDAYAWWLRTH